MNINIFVISIFFVLFEMIMNILELIVRHAHWSCVNVVERAMAALHLHHVYTYTYCGMDRNFSH